jgi:hypothetical protein
VVDEELGEKLGDNGRISDGAESRMLRARGRLDDSAAPLLTRPDLKVSSDMFKNEGAKAFYKGITPRVLRVAPGQAIVFTVRPCFLHPARDKTTPCTGDLCY